MKGTIHVLVFQDDKTPPAAVAFRCEYRLLLGALVFAFLHAWLQTRNGGEPLSATPPSPILVEPSRNSTQLHDKVDTALAELGLWPGLISKDRRDSSGVELCRVSVRVPNDLPLAIVNLALTRLVKSEGGHVFRAVEDPPGMVRMEAGFGSLRTTRFRLRLDPRLERRAGSIAIVLANFRKVLPSGLARRALLCNPPKTDPVGAS